MINYSQILQTFQKNKTKSTQGGERGEIVVGCSMLEFVYQAGSQGRTHRAALQECVEAEHAHARMHQYESDQGEGETVASVSHGPKIQC